MHILKGLIEMEMVGVVGTAVVSPTLQPDRAGLRSAVSLAGRSLKISVFCLPGPALPTLGQNCGSLSGGIDKRTGESGGATPGGCPGRTSSLSSVSCSLSASPGQICRAGRDNPITVLPVAIHYATGIIALINVQAADGCQLRSSPRSQQCDG